MKRLTFAVFAALALASIAATVSGPGRVRRFAVAASGGGGSPWTTNYNFTMVWYPFETSLTNAAGKITNAAPQWSSSWLSTPMTGAALPTWSSAAGGCASFDGGDAISNDDAWVTLGSHTTFCMMAWIYHEADYNWWQGDSSGGTMYRFSRVDPNLRLRFAGVGGDYSLTFPLSTWTHLAILWENETNTSSYGTFRVFTNGLLAASTHSATTNAQASMDRGGFIGRGYAGFYFTGKLTDFMVLTNFPAVFATSSNMVNDIYNRRKTARGL